MSAQPHNRVLWVIFLLYLAFQGVTPLVREWEAPLLPPEVVQRATAKAAVKDPDSGKYIPRSVWIAVRNASEPHPRHMDGALGFVARNNKWKVNFCGNEEKDAFMETTFANSSFLWAYNILNPVIGTAKAELWRLGVLYVHGGLYMDDDADIGMLLDDVVHPNDRFIVGKESYDWDDGCYADDYPLSNASFTKRFGALNSEVYFDNRAIFNWALFAAPGHPFLHRIILHVTELIKREYLGLSGLKPQSIRGKVLMCASTFPILVATKEVLLENGGSSAASKLGLRIGDEQFREFQGNMKAWNNDYNPQRWVKQMNKHKLPYLREYYTPTLPEILERLENHAIQAGGGKSRDIYLLAKGKRRAFPSLEAFMKMGFALDQVQDEFLPQSICHANVYINDIIEQVKRLPPNLIEQIPLGDPLPSR